LLKNENNYVKNGTLNKVNILKKIEFIVYLYLLSISDCMIKIKIACNTEEYKERNLLKVNYKLLNQVNGKAWNNIFEEFKNK